MLEVLISATIIGILTVVVSEFYADRLIDYARNFTLSILQSNTKQALESMERDVKIAQAAKLTNNITDPHASAPWTVDPVGPPGASVVLILAEPANDASNTPLWVDGLHSAVWSNEVIYYVAGNVLYQRTLKNPAAPAGNTAQTTCTVNATTPSCSGEPADAVVIEDVASMTLVYYDRSNAVVAADVANSIQTTLQQQRKVFSRTFTSSLTSRIYLRNQ